MAHAMHGSCSAHRCCSGLQHHNLHRQRPTRHQHCHASIYEAAQVVPHVTALTDAAGPAALHILAELQPSATATVPGPVDASTYTPGPVEVGWQIWFAAIVSTVPFVIGAYEFGKRILIQRRCKVCGGSGLVQRGRYQRKCPECGGFFPWISWSMFLSANARPGNGGPLLQPRGQTSVFYTVPPAEGQAVSRHSTDEPDMVAAAGASGAGNPRQQQQQDKAGDINM